MVQLWEHEILWSSQWEGECSGYFPDSNEETLKSLESSQWGNMILTKIINDLYIWSIGSHFCHDHPDSCVTDISQILCLLVGWLAETWGGKATASWSRTQAGSSAESGVIGRSKIRKVHRRQGGIIIREELEQRSDTLTEVVVVGFKHLLQWTGNGKAVNCWRTTWLL